MFGTDARAREVQRKRKIQPTHIHPPTSGKEAQKTQSTKPQLLSCSSPDSPPLTQPPPPTPPSSPNPGLHSDAADPSLPTLSVDAHRLELLRPRLDPPSLPSSHQERRGEGDPAGHGGGQIRAGTGPREGYAMELLLLVKV
jgi:hypothetical protein